MDAQTPATDATAALDAAHKNGARYVVFGSYASIGNDVRVTGQVLDVNTGKSVSAIKATGRSDQLFTLEDELAAQIRNRLGLNPAPAPTDQNSVEAQAQMEPLIIQPQAANPYLQAYGSVASPAGGPQVEIQLLLFSAILLRPLFLRRPGMGLGLGRVGHLISQFVFI